MFKYLHGYMPEYWEAQERCGLIDENAGVRFPQSLLLDESMKFNELAKKGGKLYNMISEKKLPFYIDRLQGGAYFEDYKYDKELIEEYRKLLGDDFLGFQMHEWMSNLSTDYKKLVKGECPEWTAEAIEKTIYKLFPYPALFLEAMSAEEFASKPFPKTFDEFMEIASDLFERRQQATDGMLIPCDSAGLALQLEIQKGAKILMPEVGAQTADARMQLGYARGMARAYGLKYGAYYEPWGGKPFSACCYNRDGDNEWGIGKSSDFPFETCGENGGSSRSLQKRIQLYSYLTGVDIFAEEWGICNTFYDWKDYELSPYGQVKYDFLQFVKKYPNRGEHITPIAVVLPKDMLLINGIHNDDDEIFGYRVEGEFADKLRTVRRGVRDVFADAVEMCGTEKKTLINSDIPDAFDIIHEDCENALDKYDYLIDLTSNPEFANKHKNICNIADVNNILRDILPCWVDGGVHWFVNRCGDKYLLTVFNHSGIERTVADGERELPEGEKTAEITIKSGSELLNLEGSREIVKTNSGYKVKIKSGDWFFAEFR